MSSRTTNIGLEKVTSDQTIGDLQESMNGSGGNMDIIDTKMGPVGSTSLQAQINALSSQSVKTTKITFTPQANLAAGESGYFTVPVPAALSGKTIVAVSFGINHVAQSYGYQLTGTYISALNSAYVSYYTPRAVTAANADFDMTIAYI